MKTKCIAFSLACLFILSSLSLPATACPPPDCDDCEEWDPVNKECVLKEGAECADSLDCNTCYYCMPTCTCELPYGSECGEDDPCPGACHTCVASEFGEICLCEDDDTKCTADECCDAGTCVPKCTNTGQCDGGEVPSGPFPNCLALQDPITGRCNGGEGLICNYLINLALDDAECADCEPNCDKTRISACAEIIPYRCTTQCVLWVCACSCEQKYEERTYRGDHYECE